MPQQRHLLHNNVRLKIDDCLEDFKVEPMAGTEPGGLGPLLRLIGSSADPTKGAALAIRTDPKSAIFLLRKSIKLARDSGWQLPASITPGA